MPLYLLSVCYPADATQPPPAALETIMRDVSAVGDEMVAKGVWVFSGGLSDASTATTVQSAQLGSNSPSSARSSSTVSPRYPM